MAADQGGWEALNSAPAHCTLTWRLFPLPIGVPDTYFLWVLSVSKFGYAMQYYTKFYRKTNRTRLREKLAMHVAGYRPLWRGLVIAGRLIRLWQCTRSTSREMLRLLTKVQYWVHFLDVNLIFQHLKWYFEISSGIKEAIIAPHNINHSYDIR